MSMLMMYPGGLWVGVSFVSGDGFYGLLDPGSDDLGGFDGGVDFEGWWHLFGWVCVFVFLCLGVKGDLLLPC